MAPVDLAGCKPSRRTSASGPSIQTPILTREGRETAFRSELLLSRPDAARLIWSAEAHSASWKRSNRCNASYAIIDDEPPAAGTNTAIIGHAGFTVTCPVLNTLAWGEAAIFKPSAGGDAEFVTRVLSDGWDDF